MPTSVRGNTLDLDHIWRDADSEFSAFQPRPAHLNVEWRAGLPYWAGLTAQDRADLATVNTEVGRLLTLQEIRMAWLFDNAPVVAPLYPAFTLLGIPPNVRPRYPRYNHSHAAKTNDNHPPVRVRWPKVGWDGLREFLAEALVAEGVAAWAVTDAAFIATIANPSAYAGYVAVASAPWFAHDSTIARHIGVSVAKLDYYVFE